jgi:hypothetical protein
VNGCHAAAHIGAQHRRTAAAYERRLMPRLPSMLILAALLVTIPAGVTAASAPAHEAAQVKPVKKQHHVRRIPRGVGFLPGYRTPAQIERDRHKAWLRDRRAYERSGGPPVYYYYWGYPQSRVYRGRWNGGSFGPCWTVTPIGYQWNCGR